MAGSQRRKEKERGTKSRARWGTHERRWVEAGGEGLALPTSGYSYYSEANRLELVAEGEVLVVRVLLVGGGGGGRGGGRRRGRRGGGEEGGGRDRGGDGDGDGSGGGDGRDDLVGDAENL